MFKRRVTDWLDKPNKIVQSRYCEQYIALVDCLWDLADKDERNAINAALEKILIDKHMGIEQPRYVGWQDQQIIGDFSLKLITLYDSIPSALSSKIKDRIDAFIKSNRNQANELGMFIPASGHLATAQYYANYKKAEKALARLNYYTNETIKK